MKHTPGPWTFDKKSVVKRVFSDYGGGLRNLGTHICTLADGPDIANARLIAAAPELLEALEDAVSVLVKEYGFEARDSEYIKELNRIIAKAKG